jgi:hypothetical protein
MGKTLDKVEKYSHILHDTTLYPPPKRVLMWDDHDLYHNDFTKLNRVTLIDGCKTVPAHSSLERAYAEVVLFIYSHFAKDNGVRERARNALYCHSR